jgi:hypothetical protein
MGTLETVATLLAATMTIAISVLVPLAVVVWAWRVVFGG